MPYIGLQPFTVAIIIRRSTVWVGEVYSLKFLNFIFQKLKTLKPYFTRILSVQIYTKVQSVI